MRQNVSQGAAPDPAEVARLLKELLAAVARSDFEAATPEARRLVARLEVAASAFDQLALSPRKVRA